MANLSDGTIRAAIKRVQFTGREEILRDGEGRGVGRLLLVLRPRTKRLTTYWSAAQYREGRKVQIKIGDYPSMGLAEARETFQRDYANLIQKGRHIRVARDTRTGTVGDLFDGYAEYLRISNKSSWKEAKKGLDKIADTLGRDRLAREIEPDEVTDILRPIYLRGKRSMADHVRSYVRSAYSWAMKSEHDYRSTSPRRFGITRNPAAGIPTEPKTVGTRWLRDDEFVHLYRWLENPFTAKRRPSSSVMNTRSAGPTGDGVRSQESVNAVSVMGQGAPRQTSPSVCVSTVLVKGIAGSFIVQRASGGCCR